MENENISTSPLTVAVNNVPSKSEGDKYFDDIQSEMQSELTNKANEAIFSGMMNNPMIGQYLKQLMVFMPLIVKKGEEYFGEDKVRIMIYRDEKTKALVFQKMDTANIEDLKFVEDPKEKDFFIISKEDMENPEQFLRKSQSKLGLNFI